MRYALFQDPTDASFTLVYDETRAKHTEMLRISDFVPVEFPPRCDTPQQIAEQARALDAEIAKTEARHAKKLESLNAAKTKVLSLAFQPQSVA